MRIFWTEASAASIKAIYKNAVQSTSSEQIAQEFIKRLLGQISKKALNPLEKMPLEPVLSGVDTQYRFMQVEDYRIIFRMDNSHTMVVHALYEI